MTDSTNINTKTVIDQNDRTTGVKDESFNLTGKFIKVTTEGKFDAAEFDNSRFDSLLTTQNEIIINQNERITEGDDLFTATKYPISVGRFDITKFDESIFDSIVTVQNKIIVHNK